MRSLFLLIGLALVVAEDQLELAAPCDESLCKLPDCRCSSFEIPGGLRARDIPQFVTVTFDDAVNVINILNYRETLYNRVNSNGCKAGATFYVSHEYTDYTLVNELYNQGYQIALHSITHMTNQTYWREASYDEIRLEFVDQRAQIAQFANIPASAISGVRIPFLQLNGNNSFRVIKDYDLGYDCSWPSNSFSSSPLWPYTLDYASIQDCPIPPCPNASIPGAWVQPMVSWVDLNGFPCSMVDACIFAPDHQDADAWFRFIVQNFERHYLNNRAPFGFYIHEAFFQAHPAVKTAFIKFLDLINNLHDVFMVNSNEVIDWVKNPVPIEEYRSQACRSTQFTPCFNRSCGPLRGDHNVWLEYYMQLCATTCPSVYPWLGNPFGL